MRRNKASCNLFSILRNAFGRIHKNFSNKEESGCNLVFTLTNTSSASIVCVLMASVTLSATNSWLTGALAGGLVTNATITVHCVGKHTLTA